MSAVYRRGVEAEILADNPPHSVQLPNRYPRQMAWKPLSVRPALSIRSARDLGRRIRRPVHSRGLDKPRPLRSTMASTHGNLVLPPSRPVAEGGTEDHRSRRAIAPPIASRLSESAFASGPPKVSSPRCSPDAYTSSAYAADWTQIATYTAISLCHNKPFQREALSIEACEYRNIWGLQRQPWRLP